MSLDAIPSLTINPLPERGSGVVSKFAGANNPAAPYAVTAVAEASFGDLVDIVNPLQHLPIIGNIYRAVTGDESSVATQVAGGALYGGPIGMLISLASSVFGELFGASEAELAANAAKTQTAVFNPALPDIRKTV